MNNKILFINDYTATSTVPDIASQAGYSVDTALKLETALGKPDMPDYDLIILMASPYAQSWLACENIRQATGRPLIVISTYASPETCVKAINAGADYFMRMPFGPMELVARINSLFQRVAYHQPMSLVS
jgi:two-component system, OmpR family, response regulator